MASRNGSGPSLSRPARARCRCGHLPTHHMVVVAVRGTGEFRLEPSGPCAICGEAVCRRFAPGPP